MSWFEEQIRKRKEKDQEAFEESIRTMTGAVMGNRIARALDKDRTGAGDAISEVLNYYHVDVKNIQEQIQNTDDINETLENATRPFGIMRRIMRFWFSFDPLSQLRYGWQ